MTEVAFHFNAPDKLAYACRLLRKAAGMGSRVAVTAEADFLQRLDTALWTFSPLDFVPHATERQGQALLEASPVVLLGSVLDAPHQHVLLNLGESVPEGFERFERLIEVVSLDDADRLRARERWKHYAARGYAIERKDLVLKAA
ncbi:DNA polymerase III subunit chi [Rhodoferax koreense]|uniref:DNA polymerase III subunit chi n=1 Tax=Rhodoferax koreensis TaxID=1842727 RepID=A0A1P8JWJ8_9BURK|nr:DNA polymerase III subunit chi [Rhodoferax koreense]APW38134.1 DNA polymerase III subunit chi [Rhodoferax koreense]